MVLALELLVSVVLAGWVAVDAAQRGRSWYGWSRLAFFASIFGAAAWMVARRKSPVMGELLAPVRRVLLALAGVPLAIFTFVTSLAVTSFVVQVGRVDGQAMAPTLQDKDRVIVNKMAYRFSAPRRGDIVMMYYPLDPDRTFVKRVIAQQGDTVRILDGRVSVNDVAQKDDYVAPEFRSHDDWGPMIIAQGYYFVMGDRRNNSSDSRHWGLVPKRYIIGKIAEPERRPVVTR